VCVGSRAKFIAETSKMSQDKIFIFDTSDDAKFKIRDLIRERDVILVKGSQGMRMEKIVAEIIAEPQRKKELLVRQSKRWLSK
jgi:UDP-N-acetylmuramyl pentapeptide synthase